MPPLPAVNTFISVDEYMEGELHSEIRHEYVDGQVYAMGGASDSHGLIVNALAFALTPAARYKHCQLFTSDMKLRLNIADKTVFYYPDLLLSCAPDDRQPYFRSRPCLIVEVLSNSQNASTAARSCWPIKLCRACRNMCWWRRTPGGSRSIGAPTTGRRSTSTRGRFGSIAWRAVCPSMPSMRTLNRLKHRRRTRLPHPEFNC